MLSLIYKKVGNFNKNVMNYKMIKLLNLLKDLINVF